MLSNNLSAIMNKLTKKIIIISTIIIVTLLASVGFYYWSNHTSQNNTPQTTEGTNDSSIFDGGNNNSVNTNFSSSASANSQSSSRFEAELPILRQISNTPIAGGIAFKKGGYTIIRYVDRGTGHIYETNDHSLENTTVSNTTIPKVPESIWSSSGQSVIMRYLNENNNTILSFSANIIISTTSQDISKNPKSAFLPSNIEQLSVNPSGDKIFYLTNDVDGSVGAVSSIDGSQKRRIFQSPIQEWLASWTNNEIITLATKPAYNASGYLFFLNSKSGATNKIMSGINGLTALISSTTKNIIYSESIDGSFKLKYRNLSNTNGDKELSFKTLPEKCVWSKTEEYIVYCAVPAVIMNADYPDEWYQGLISFTDSVWRIDTKTDSSELVFDIKKETSNDIDIMNPFLSESDEYLFFMNKKDLTFWSLALKKQLLNKSEEEGFRM